MQSDGYYVYNSNKTVSANGVIVDVKYIENKSHSRLIASAIVAPVIAFAIFFQVAGVLVSAQNSNPLSSPLSTPLTAPIIAIINGGSSNGGVGAPNCNDAQPKNAPSITAKAISNTQVQINWGKQEDITKYSLSFGTQSGKYTFGVDTINKNYTSWTVSKLSPNTNYYFSLKGINGCNGSSPSNEVMVKTTIVKSYNTYTNSQVSLNTQNGVNIDLSEKPASPSSEEAKMKEQSLVVEPTPVVVAKEKGFWANIKNFFGGFLSFLRISDES